MHMPSTSNKIEWEHRLCHWALWEELELNIWRLALCSDSVALLMPLTMTRLCNCSPISGRRQGEGQCCDFTPEYLPGLFFLLPKTHFPSLSSQRYWPGDRKWGENTWRPLGHVRADFMTSCPRMSSQKLFFAQEWAPLCTISQPILFAFPWRWRNPSESWITQGCLFCGWWSNLVLEQES